MGSCAQNSESVRFQPSSGWSFLPVTQEDWLIRGDEIRTGVTAPEDPHKLTHYLTSGSPKARYPLSPLGCCTSRGALQPPWRPSSMSSLVRASRLDSCPLVSFPTLFHCMVTSSPLLTGMDIFPVEKDTFAVFEITDRNVESLLKVPRRRPVFVMFYAPWWVSSLTLPLFLVFISVGEGL